MDKTHFQNDISFVKEDIQISDVDNFPKILDNLMIKFINESIAAPYCFDWEVEELCKEPDSWNLRIDQSKNRIPNKIRITIWNAYPRAERHFNESLNNVELIGEDIGNLNIEGEDETIIAITEIKAPFDTEAQKELYELDTTTSGESPIKITITPGGGFEPLYYGEHDYNDDDIYQMTFTCPGKFDKNQNFIVENIDPIMKYLQALKMDPDFLENNPEYS